MSLTLPNFNVCPPGGWRWTCPQTGKMIPNHPAATWGELQDAISEYCIANSIPVPVAAVVIDELCHQLPSGYCRDTDARQITPLAGKKLRWSSIFQGTLTLGETLVRGKKLVAQEVADARAAVCATCSLNQPAPGCQGCASRTARELVGRFIGDRKTQFDNELKACNACLCELRVKIWVPKDIILHWMPAEQLKLCPETCWLLNER